MRTGERIEREGRAAHAALQRIARGADSDDPLTAEQGRSALKHLARFRERTFDQYADHLLPWAIQAVCGGIPGISPELTRQLRAKLVRHGWLTLAELDTLPETMLTDIAGHRFRRWCESGDPMA